MRVKSEPGFANDSCPNRAATKKCVHHNIISQTRFRLEPPDRPVSTTTQKTWMFQHECSKNTVLDAVGRNPFQQFNMVLRICATIKGLPRKPLRFGSRSRDYGS